MMASQYARLSYRWLVAIPFFGLSTLAIGLPLIVISLMGFGDLGSRTLAVLWAKLNSIVLRMQVTVEGRDNIKPQQSYVLVANHESALDILLIYGYLPIELKWVMKKELRRVPIIGGACAAMGHILIDRSNSTQAVESIQNASAKLTQGMSVMFFPEGTRSNDGRILPFKKGAFRLAVDLSIPVLPITIEGTRNMLPTGTLDWRPGRVALRIHPALRTAELTSRSVAELSNRAESMIRQQPGNEHNLSTTDEVLPSCEKITS